MWILDLMLFREMSVGPFDESIINNTAFLYQKVNSNNVTSMNSLRLCGPRSIGASLSMGEMVVRLWC